MRSTATDGAEVASLIHIHASPTTRLTSNWQAVLNGRIDDRKRRNYTALCTSMWLKMKKEAGRELKYQSCVGRVQPIAMKSTFPYFKLFLAKRMVDTRKFMSVTIPIIRLQQYLLAPKILDTLTPPHDHRKISLAH